MVATVETRIEQAATRHAGGSGSGVDGRRIAGLDLLRLVAALSVLVFHYGFRGAAGQNLSTVAYPQIAGLAMYGFYGLDLFFMISGFVIAASAEGRGALDFAIARTARLYPAYVISMTLSALAIALWGIEPHHVNAVKWLANLSMVAPAFGQPFMDGAYWSIVLELVFYGWVGFFILCGVFERRIVEIVACWLVVCLVNEVFLHSKALQYGAISEYGPLFASGVLIHRLWRDDRRCAGRAALWALLAVAVGLETFHAVEVRNEFTRLYSQPMSLWTLWAIQFSLYGVFVGALAASRYIPATPLVLALGGITYPLYLLHQNVGYISLGRLAPVIGRWPALAVVIAGMIGTAWLIWRYAEPPARRAIKRLAAETLGPGRT